MGPHGTWNQEWLCWRGSAALYPNRTQVVQWLRLDLSNGPNRVGVSPLTWGRKRIQFPKRCVFPQHTGRSTKSKNPIILILISFLLYWGHERKMRGWWRWQLCPVLCFDPAPSRLPASSKFLCLSQFALRTECLVACKNTKGQRKMWTESFHWNYFSRLSVSHSLNDG
jgi:hypothetical protein